MQSSSIKCKIMKSIVFPYSRIIYSLRNIYSWTMNVLQPTLHRSCYGAGRLHTENKSNLTKSLTQSCILAGPIVWALDWGSKDDQINQIVRLLSRSYNNPNLSQNCTIHNSESAERFAVQTSDCCLHARHTSLRDGQNFSKPHFVWFQVSII